jgi:hypothetical protein
MPYPLPGGTAAVGGERIRLLPPIGCPGTDLWVLPMEVQRWEDLGYRRGPVPADPLELFWLPESLRWNEAVGSVPIELRIEGRTYLSQPVTVSWGDGTEETISWPSLRREPIRLRHLYAERADVTVQVQWGLAVSELSVALLGCPVPPLQLQRERDGGGTPTDGAQPLLASGGLAGEAYDGRHAVLWRLRLHPEGGLGLLPDTSGEPALAMTGTRASRWYAGDGPPTTDLSPVPVVGDFYLDRLSGQVYELAP